MRTTLIAAIAALLTGCGWHLTKPGFTTAQFEADTDACRATYKYELNPTAFAGKVQGCLKDVYGYEDAYR